MASPTPTCDVYLLDGQLSNYPSWRSYFDVIVVDAKSRSFLGDRPMAFLDERGAPLPVGELPAQRPLLCQGGNVQALSELLAMPADRVLYVGDHIYGDMLRAKSHRSGGRR